MRLRKNLNIILIVFSLLVLILAGCCGDEDETGYGSIYGTVYDAITTEPLMDVTVEAGGVTTTTGEDGTYMLENVPAGEVEVVASKDGYVTNTQYVNVTANTETTGVNFYLSETLLTGQIRIVLTWGEEPVDLDSWLLIPTSDTDGSLGYSLFYGDMGSETGYPYAVLDVDDIDSFGPETITIYNRFTQTYRYFVHNYSGEPDITTSQAMVEVYDDTGKIRTYYVPESGTGLYWHVFDIDPDGNIVDVNQILETMPGLNSTPGPLSITPPKN